MSDDAKHTIPATFTAGGHDFTQQAGSLIWFATDGYRFWLGEEVKAGVWTMGADDGQTNPVFAFGLFDGPEETVAEFERLVGR